jgi:hypothetical protein
MFGSGNYRRDRIAQAFRSFSIPRNAEFSCLNFFRFSHPQRLVTQIPSRFRFCCAALAALSVAGLCAQGTEATAAPETPIELPAKEMEKKEKSVTVGAAMDRLKALEAEVEALRAKSKNLSESLAVANTESERNKEDYSRMRLQMEALGVAAVNGDERSLQTRLLDAANDFRLSEKSKKALTEQLVQLSEASIAFMKSSDAASRERLEAALQGANTLLQATTQLEQPAPTALGAAKVVSFKSDLGLAVVNAGKQSGLRLGMPVSFVRKDRAVAKGVIVDCRDQITGVLITTSESKDDSVAVGDAIKLEPTKLAQE